jgi:hypothetical protein
MERGARSGMVKDEGGKIPEPPEKIKRHAPRPVLRPGGNWRRMADQVDRMVEEKHDADRARDVWSARLDASQKRGLGYRITRGTS